MFSILSKICLHGPIDWAAKGCPSSSLDSLHVTVLHCQEVKIHLSCCSVLLEALLHMSAGVIPRLDLAVNSLGYLSLCIESLVHLHIVSLSKRVFWIVYYTVAWVQEGISRRQDLVCRLTKPLLVPHLLHSKTEEVSSQCGKVFLQILDSRRLA